MWRVWVRRGGEQGLGGETGGKETTGRPRRRWLDLQEVGCGYMDWIGLAQDRQVADACECGNEPSGSVKCGEFLDYLQTS